MVSPVFARAVGYVPATKIVLVEGWSGGNGAASSAFGLCISMGTAQLPMMSRMIRRIWM
jgi:hypothetical protein